MREAILEGVSNGRDKLGSIYVVPDGSEYISGSGLASSINTITVNYVGFNGRLPRRPQISASVLTSGLGEGNRLDTSSIVSCDCTICIINLKYNLYASKTLTPLDISTRYYIKMTARPIDS
ncbi:uncharacterized protein LOC132755076 [Ruditapes philippinarum]|uniref:uncharacterized protein LOC132755076 n=1 Tax=Ruditapes philippinarum TaxID=129788 RepID=UPI00295A8762|nr:uncharacterized protein LOC132755076 [Ruditapes philippinarum]